MDRDILSDDNFVVPDNINLELDFYDGVALHFMWIREHKLYKKGQTKLKPSKDLQELIKRSIHLYEEALKKV